MALNGLKLVDLSDKPVLSEAQRRRARLLNNIVKQIERTNGAAKGQKPRGIWWWKDADGKFVLPIKYGRHPLDLGKGKKAVLCDDLDAVIIALDKAEAAAIAGDFDVQLEQLSAEIRRGFDKERE